MNFQRHFVRWGAGVLLVVTGGVGGYLLGHRGMTPMEPPKAVSAPATPHDRPVLYWYDPMKPDQHFHKPGKSPFMDMDLVPMYAEDTGRAPDSGVLIDPRLLQNTGVKYAAVAKGTLDRTLRVAGTLAFDDRLVTVIQARTAGWVEKVYDWSPGDILAAGDALVDMRVPEWYGAQAEYLALRKAGETELADAARMRLLQLGMTEGQVKEVDARGMPQAVLTITVPRGGVLQELGVRAGMTLLPGQTLARINGIGSVWLNAEVPEALSDGLTVGQPVRATLTAWPGQVFTGRIAALLPVLEPTTRTLQVRIEWPNPGGRLRPGMYAQVDLKPSQATPRLLVPADAVIATGHRRVVIVAGQDGHFMPAEVTTGREAGGQMEVLSGLQEGERVVVSGEFLIDSEASLKGVLARMEKAGAAR